MADVLSSLTANIIVAETNFNSLDIITIIQKIFQRVSEFSCIFDFVII